MMVAVTLLLVIISALLAMFYQTQRAFRLSATQEDILEAGRAEMELLTGELPEITPSGRDNQVNLFAQTPYALLIQPRTAVPNGTPRVNVLQDIFFLRQHNDDWIGTGYFVSSTNDAIGTLYRFEETVHNTNIFAMPALLTDFLTATTNVPPPPNSHRVIDRVVTLRLTPFDSQGLFWTNLNDVSFSVTPLFNEPVYTGFSFTNTALPAYLDLELGIFEPRAYEKYRALAEVSAPRAFQFLSNHVEKVHIFRQRIPLRTAQ